MPLILKLTELTGPQSASDPTVTASPGAYALADINNHYTIVLRTLGAKRITIIANSTLDQIVTIQLYASKDSAVSGTADAQGNKLLTNYYKPTATNTATIAATPSPAWSELFAITELHGFLQIQFSCSVKPTTGSIDIWAMFEIGEH